MTEDERELIDKLAGRYAERALADVRTQLHAEVDRFVDKVLSERNLAEMLQAYLEWKGDEYLQALRRAASHPPKR